jgi:membrane protease YdiL (CAAX protease family)
VLSQKPLKGETVLLLVLTFFVVNGLGGLGVQLIEKFGAGLRSDDRQFWETVVQAFSFQGMGLILVALFLWWERITWNEAFGLRNSSPGRVIGLGIIAGILVLPTAWALQQLSVTVLSHFEVDSAPQEIIQKLQTGRETVPHQAYFFVVAVIGAPLIEEILFRGIIYPTVKQLGFPKLAFWGTTLLWAATHVNSQAFLPLVFFGVALTMLYDETDNLLTPIIAHSCFNAANFLLLVFRDPLTDLFQRVL